MSRQAEDGFNRTPTARSRIASSGRRSLLAPLGPAQAPSGPAAGQVRSVSFGGTRQRAALSPGSPTGLLGGAANARSWSRSGRGGATSPGGADPLFSPGDGSEDDDATAPAAEPEVIVPKMLPELKTPEYQTPLPKIAMIVLGIIMVGEFMSASVGGPFLFPMLKDNGTPSGSDEASIGFWAGIVSAVFFLSQFATALIWGNVALRIGRRNVLLISLLGNTSSLLLYGTSSSVPAMMLFRIFQGAFNGAVGVARTAVKDITDPTNEGRAYAVMGVCWSLGGIVGPIFGGWLEHPVENIPRWFGGSTLFARFPYLLPTMAAGSVTFTGAILCLFLSYDGGAREGGIRLPEEKDVEHAVTAVAAIPRTVTKKVSGLLNQAIGSTSAAHVTEESQPLQSPTPLDIRNDDTVRRKPSRTSFAIPHHGSAYGYGRRDTGLSRYRRMSTATTRYALDYEGGGGGTLPEAPPLNFAQRLLLANDEAAVFNISDLWIAAATRDEDPYASGAIEEDVFEDDEEAERTRDESYAIGDLSEDIDPFVEDTSTNGLLRSRRESTATGTTERRRSPMKGAHVNRLRSTSMASSFSRPAIYQNTGLIRSPVTSPAPHRDQQQQPQGYFDAAPPSPTGPQPSTTLSAIPEGRSAEGSGAGLLTVPGPAAGPDVSLASLAEENEKHPLETFSIWKDLPIPLIAQYTVLGLHGTITDQIFISYLVTKPSAGGLGLEASDYADIIAFMCFFQMLFQFRFMFRLGLCLYLIPYTFFPELRPLLGPNGEKSGVITFGLILLTATRYLANTCAYTAVMILINAMTPPAYLPLANGLAQSTISLARFFGPLSGGMIWSKSIADGPAGYYVGFVTVAVICLLGLAHSFTIR